MGQLRVCHLCQDVLDEDRGVEVSKLWACPKCLNLRGINAKAIKAERIKRESSLAGRFAGRGAKGREQTEKPRLF
jgi:hypothetical protein